MKEEFAAYGLSSALMSLVGIVKSLLAVALIVGIWIPEITNYAAAGLALALLAAVAAHFKIQDPVKKSAPAATLMTMSVAILVL